MKAFGFRLESDPQRDFLQLATDLAARPLRDRRFVNDNGALRLEALRHAGDFLFIDFAGERNGHGPGRMAPDQPIAEIDLEPQERFGEDTAMVLHIPTGTTAVQYNHQGPRYTAIQKYINAANLSLINGAGHSDYNLAIKLSRDAYARLRAYGIIQEIEFTIATPGILSGDARRGISLGRALQAPLPEGAKIFNLSMRAKRGEEIQADDAIEFVEELLSRGEDLIKAKVWGKQNERQRKRPVNLLNDQLSHTADIRRHRGQRYAREERWAGLHNAMLEWARAGEVEL